MIDLDDDRLHVVLASMTELLVTDAAAARVAHRPRRVAPAIWVGVAVAAVIAATVLAVAPLRHTVADWLGIGSTAIEIDPTAASTISSLPSITLDLTRIDRAGAEATLGVALPSFEGTELGAPQGFALMPEGGVLVVWSDRTTLWIHRLSIPTDVLFTKMVAAGSMVQRVDDLGDDALAVSGEHVLRTPHRTVAAATTVLWRQRELEYRLDADRDVDALIDLARALAAAG